MVTQPPVGAQEMALLRTKLYTPPPRPELVPRPRLIERLNTGLRRKLTLISTPAGFGKQVALFSLDKNSSDAALGLKISKRLTTHRCPGDDWKVSTPEEQGLVLYLWRSSTGNPPAAQP